MIWKSRWQLNPSDHDEEPRAATNGYAALRLSAGLAGCPGGPVNSQKGQEENSVCSAGRTASPGGTRAKGFAKQATGAVNYAGWCAIGDQHLGAVESNRPRRR